MYFFRRDRSFKTFLDKSVTDLPLLLKISIFQGTFNDENSLILYFVYIEWENMGFT